MNLDNYKFRFMVKMINGKKYEIITNMYLEADVLEYIDKHKYIALFDRKLGDMVTVKSQYVMSVMYKDSKEDKQND